MVFLVAHVQISKIRRKNRVKNYKNQSESIGVIFSGNKQCDDEAELEELSLVSAHYFM